MFGAKRTLLALTLLLVAVKTAFVISIADVFFYLEELDHGAVAKALLDDLGLPHHQLAKHLYEGGAFAVAHVKGVLFLVFGPCVLVHKLLALAWCLATLVVGYRLALRHFGLPAAVAFGLLFVFGPESFQKLTLLSLGNHVEACLFVLLLLDGALAITLQGEDSPRRFALLGVVAGFGCYFSYQVAVFVAIVAVWIVVQRRRAALGRPGLCALAGFAVGALPLWIMLALVGTEVFDVHGLSLLERRGNGEALGRMFRSLFIEPGAREVASAVAFSLATLLASVYVVLADRRRAGLLVSALALWTVAYATGPFVFGRVYYFFVLARLAPAWIVATLVVAVALGGLWQTRRPVTLALGGALLAVGIVNTAAILADSRPGEAAANVRRLVTMRGYAYPNYMAKLLARLEIDERARLSALARFDDSRALVCGDLASVAFVNPSRDLESILAVVDEVDHEHRADFLRGLGPYLSARAGHDVVRALAATRGSPDQELFAEAVGRFGGSYVHSKESLRAEIARILPQPGAEAYLRGVGYRIYRNLVASPYGAASFLLDPDAARRFIAEQPEAAVPHLVEGFHRAQRERTL